MLVCCVVVFAGGACVCVLVLWLGYLVLFCLCCVVVFCFGWLCCVVCFIFVALLSIGGGLFVVVDVVVVLFCVSCGVGCGIVAWRVYVDVYQLDCVIR